MEVNTIVINSTGRETPRTAQGVAKRAIKCREYSQKSGSALKQFQKHRVLNLVADYTARGENAKKTS